MKSPGILGRIMLVATAIIATLMVTAFSLGHPFLGGYLVLSTATGIAGTRWLW